MEGGTFFTECVCSFDDLHAGAWFDQDEVMHHQVRVVEGELDFLTGKDVEDLGIEVKPDRSPLAKKSFKYRELCMTSASIKGGLGREGLRKTIFSG